MQSPCHAENVTVFVPSQTGIERDYAVAAQAAKEKKGNKNIQDSDTHEVDILFSMMNPFEYNGFDMDMPQLFASIHYPRTSGMDAPKPERKDMLADIEQIRYLGRKAWGANVALEQPGLYQLIMDAKPWWDEERGIFLQQQAKVLLPVLGIDNGWHMPAGQSFEILPLTRPFGLTAPAIFNGRVLLDGKPLENTPVYMGRINSGKAGAITEWHKRLAAMSDSSGQFSFALNQPGWWYCEAVTQGSELKGPDGQPKPVERAAILWLYIDAQTEKAKK